MRRRLFKLLFPAEYKREQHRLLMERAAIVCEMMSRGGRREYSSREDLIDFITNIDPLESGFFNPNWKIDHDRQIQAMQAMLNRIESKKIDGWTVHTDPAAKSGKDRVYAFGFGTNHGQ